MTTSRLNTTLPTIDARLVARLTREYNRAIRAEEAALDERQAWRLAKISEKCLRRLQAAQAGQPLPEPRMPRTARNLGKLGFAALATIGRHVARAVATQAALRKAQAVCAARRTARKVRQAFRRAVRTIVGRVFATVRSVAPTTTKETRLVTFKPVITASTITDAQLRDLLDRGTINHWTYGVAMTTVLGLGGERRAARAHCAKLFNAARNAEVA